MRPFLLEFKIIGCSFFMCGVFRVGIVIYCPFFFARIEIKQFCGLLFRSYDRLTAIVSRRWSFIATCSLRQIGPRHLFTRTPPARTICKCIISKFGIREKYILHMFYSYIQMVQQLIQGTTDPRKDRDQLRHHTNRPHNFLALVSLWTNISKCKLLPSAFFSISIRGKVQQESKQKKGISDFLTRETTFSQGPPT